MKRLFIVITAVLLMAGCAGMGGTSSGASGTAGASSSFSDPSNLYFGG